MKNFWRITYLLHFTAPVACSLLLHLLFQRASVLLGYPPQYLINSPQDFGGDATFSRLDNFASALSGICWMLFFFGSAPILISLLWPLGFRSRWLRVALFAGMVWAWGYWATDAVGGWYLD